MAAVLVPVFELILERFTCYELINGNCNFGLLTC